MLYISKYRYMFSFSLKWEHIIHNVLKPAFLQFMLDLQIIPYQHMKIHFLWLIFSSTTNLKLFYQLPNNEYLSCFQSFTLSRNATSNNFIPISFAYISAYLKDTLS